MLPSDEGTVVPLYVVVHRLMISLKCILSCRASEQELEEKEERKGKREKKKKKEGG